MCEMRRGVRVRPCVLCVVCCVSCVSSPINSERQSTPLFGAFVRARQRVRELFLRRGRMMPSAAEIENRIDAFFSVNYQRPPANAACS